MNYLLINENAQLIGVYNYKPNVSADNIKILSYSGNIPPERILYQNGKIEDINNFIFVNGKYVKRTKTIENIFNTNKTAKKYLSDTDWLVVRHRDQLDLKQKTSLTENQYLDLLEKRQEAREKVINYDK